MCMCGGGGEGVVSYWRACVCACARKTTSLTKTTPTKDSTTRFVPMSCVLLQGNQLGELILA